jgi:hypothetical protein
LTIFTGRTHRRAMLNHLCASGILQDAEAKIAEAYFS